MTEVVRPNSTKTKIKYDDEGSITELVNYKESKKISSFTYTYDRANKLTMAENKENTGNWHDGRVSVPDILDPNSKVIIIAGLSLRFLLVSFTFSAQKNGRIVKRRYAHSLHTVSTAMISFSVYLLTTIHLTCVAYIILKLSLI